MNKARENLKRKIISCYGTIGEFCTAANLSKCMVSYIINGHRDGSVKTWHKIQETLEIKDDDMWIYQRLNK